MAGGPTLRALLHTVAPQLVTFKRFEPMAVFTYDRRRASAWLSLWKRATHPTPTAPPRVMWVCLHAVHGCPARSGSEGLWWQINRCPPPLKTAAYVNKEFNDNHSRWRYLFRLSTSANANLHGKKLSAAFSRKARRKEKDPKTTTWKDEFRCD